MAKNRFIVDFLFGAKKQGGFDKTFSAVEQRQKPDQDSSGSRRNLCKRPGTEKCIDVRSGKCIQSGGIPQHLKRCHEGPEKGGSDDGMGGGFCE